MRVLPNVGSFGPASPDEILRPAKPWFIVLSLLLGLVANLVPVSGVVLELRPHPVALALPAAVLIVATAAAAWISSRVDGIVVWIVWAAWLAAMLGFVVPRFVAWFTSIFSEQGVFGQTLEVSSTFIIMFVIFAAFLSRSGAGDYFNNLAVALVGWARGGPAKVAVVSGVMFGSISGSSVANVVASGTITIPMMRRVGYDRATAAAIEATSSTGGQITPPVLGAGAFIMAEVTGTPYPQIALAAIIPCLLFYVANYTHCHLHALRHGLRGLPRHELPALVPMLGRLHYVAPIAILIYAFVTGFSAFRAAEKEIANCVPGMWLPSFFVGEGEGVRG